MGWQISRLTDRIFNSMGGGLGLVEVEASRQQKHIREARQMGSVFILASVTIESIDGNQVCSNKVECTSQGSILCKERVS